MLDMKADAAHLVAGRRNQDGVLLSQNGQWDDTFLCDAHERIVGTADDYAVRFIRRRLPAATLRAAGGMVVVENPRPEQLLHFAFAVVWRHVVCARGQETGLNLGQYEQQIRDALVSNGPYDLELIVGFNPVTVKGEWIQLALAPYREKMPVHGTSLNVWHFTVGGLDFYLKTDGRLFPTGFRPYLANDNNPLLLGRRNKREIHTIPKLVPILRGMMRTTWEPPDEP